MIKGVIPAILVSVGFLIYFLNSLFSLDEGTDELKKFAAIIRNSSYIFLFKQYRIIWLFSAAMAAVFYKYYGFYAALACFVGVVFSSLSCFLTIFIATKGNVRIAWQSNYGFSQAFRASILTAISAALLVSVLCLSSIFIVYKIALWTYNPADILSRYLFNKILLCYSIALSVISISARVGGGTFTKSADVGADLSGKVHADLPEDSPLNPASTADATGDNVGDIAGIGVDLFETVGATICMALILLPSMADVSKIFTIYIFGLFASLFSIFGFSYQNVSEIYNYLKASLLTFAVLTLCGGELTISTKKIGLKIFSRYEIYCILAGILALYLVLKNVEYFTSPYYYPVQAIAKSSESGAGNNIISGLSVGNLAAPVPLFIICVTMLFSYHLLGVKGIIFSVLGMICPYLSILVQDFIGGPVDNAGFFVEMTGDGKEEITSELDTMGNITKAITKGFTISTAKLASLIMFLTYKETVNIPDFTLNLLEPRALGGMLLGLMIVCIFSGVTLLSVSKGAQKVYKYVVDNLDDIISKKKAPDYYAVIEILSNHSLKEMILPMFSTIFITLSSYFIAKYLYGPYLACQLLGGLMLGVDLLCTYLGISMTVSGGAWDNAKKYIERYGKKGSDVHKAAVIGDTVGDPLKDTTGPAQNSLMKLVSLIGMLLIS
jgi:K(+)-stimulated pyrophosphate-energized sodium pump